MLLARAVPRPDLVRSKDGGAALSLALHCLMVDAGFRPLDVRGRPAGGSSGFQPLKDWNTKFVDEWVFMYCRWEKVQQGAVARYAAPTQP